MQVILYIVAWLLMTAATVTAIILGRIQRRDIAWQGLANRELVLIVIIAALLGLQAAAWVGLGLKTGGAW